MGAEAPRPRRIHPLRRLALQAGLAACLLAGMELFLRITGYSPRWSPLYHTFSATRLYVPSVVGGLPGFHTNRTYLQDFHEAVFTREKGGSFRIFSMGGSATHGWRLPDRGRQNFTALLASQLSQKHPGMVFEGINAAGCGWGSFREQVLTRELLAHQPDLLIVMTGNNEGLEYPLYRDFSSTTINRVRVGMIAEKSRLFLLAFNISTGMMRKKGYHPAIEGHYEFLDGNEWKSLLEKYESNIRSTIIQCRESRVPVIFGTTPANLGVNPDDPNDWLTGSSRHSPGLTAEMLSHWNREFKEGMERRKRGDFKGGLDCFQRAVSIDPGYAREYHEMAACLEGLGRYSGAREAYWKHVDLNRRLVTREINAITVRVCRELAVPLMDCVSAFEKASPHGITGYQLFVDSMHPNVRGHEVLAQAFYGAVERQVTAGK